MEARQLEDEVEIEGGAPASVSDVGAASGADQIVSEGSQASGDVGVLADAGSVLGEGGVAHVVAAVLDPPMGADPFVPALRRWIPTRSATPSTALVPQRKVGFPIPNAGLLLGFQGTKTARREGISSPFSDAGGCTSRQNSGAACKRLSDLLIR